MAGAERYASERSVSAAAAMTPQDIMRRRSVALGVVQPRTRNARLAWVSLANVPPPKTAAMAAAQSDACAAAPIRSSL